ncbi:sensor histidine kinase [Sediminitomix flava]|uniref:histidine kinase n=1 Tax=Sediminitomix flava TaxID=379075 RepID=A0A315YWV2_SEDFL|nr:ATP-binding protein [Sediminitomix flava]PWJ34123.1 histidine kinase/DNA gyrase B/HSP90-like ATPase [Sediminitomix flava]
MGFKNFRQNIIARVLGLCVSIYFMTALFYEHMYGTGILLGILVVYQTLALINLVDRSNQEMISFFNSIRYDDLSSTYRSENTDASFADLNQEFNKVLARFREIRAEKESHYQYLKNIIHHVGIGVLSFDSQGKIQIVNNAAKRLLRFQSIRFVHELEDFSEELYEALKNLKTGARTLVRVQVGKEKVQLAIYVIELYLQGKEYKLATFQNIHNELEEQEMEAWQNLIRVLTHEIMNSVTPVSSLAGTLEGELEYLMEKEDDIEKEELEDFTEAVQVIQKRSESLIRFVNEFRSLTHVPEPKLAHTRVEDIFAHIRLLMDSECNGCDISLNTIVDPESLLITVDAGQIEQVLINMVKNAIQSFETQTKSEPKCITLKAKVNPQTGKPEIKVRDNGAGIDSEALDRIFIPFFTTKPKGSGIGLSLSKQIMRYHKGTITVHSKVGEGTEFILKF